MIRHRQLWLLRRKWRARNWNTPSGRKLAIGSTAIASDGRRTRPAAGNVSGIRISRSTGNYEERFSVRTEVAAFSENLDESGGDSKTVGQKSGRKQNAGEGSCQVVNFCIIDARLIILPSWGRVAVTSKRIS